MRMAALLPAAALLGVAPAATEDERFDWPLQPVPAADYVDPLELLASTPVVPERQFSA